jgi:hypothetical protein
MSLLEVNAVQLGQSLTASQNFTWYQPASPDGTVRLGNGNSGSVTDLITVGSTGNLTFANSVTLSAASTKTLTLNGGAGSNGLVIDASNNVSVANNLTLSNGTPNGVVYLNGSKAASSSSNFVYDGTNLTVASGILLKTSAGSTSLFFRNIAGTNRIDSYNDPITAPTPLLFNASRYTFSCNDSDKIWIDSSGNLGLGATSTGYKFFVSGSLPSGGIFVQSNSGANASPVIRVQGQRSDTNTSQSFSGGLALERYYSGGTITSGQILGSIYFGGNYSGSTVGYTASISAVASANWGGSTTAYTDLIFLTGTDTTGLGVPNTSYGTEKLRIDYSGNLCKGVTSAYSTAYGTGEISFYTNSAGMVFRVAGASGSSVPTCQVFVNAAGTSVGYIAVGAGVVNFTSTSDYRLKTNVSPMLGGLDRVNKLKPVTFTWKETGANSEGFLAHEVQEIVPLAVTGIKDEVTETGKIKPQGVDPAKIVPILVKAIQELSAELNELKQRIK